MKIVGYSLLAGLSVAFCYAAGATFLGGHAAHNTTQHVPWGLWVAFYIFFLGLSAGSYLLSSLIYVFGVKRLAPAGPVALLQALGCLVLGGFLIVADLGHPGRGYLVLTSFNPSSVMAWMGIGYIAYVAIVVAQLWLVLRPGMVARMQTSRLYRLLILGQTRVDAATTARDHRWLMILGIIGIPVAIMVNAGVGSIFAVAKARPGWFSGLFPIVFLISALASGGALLAGLTATFSRLPPARRTPLVTDLIRFSFGILCFDALLLSSELLVTLYGGIPSEAAAWRMVLGGPFWWVFWFFQLGLGFVVPGLLIALPRTRASNDALGLAGLFIVIGIMGTRLNLVIPAQIRPVFEALPDAYHHARNALGYAPSGVEWALALGTVAVGFWMFLIAKKTLPLEEIAA